MTSTVGIVVRTKDRPRLLARALGDIAAQTYRDWHVVVVDDRSEDVGAVDRVVRDSGIPDQQLTILRTVATSGRCAAANQGIRALDSDLVVLHDDDDLWDPSFLQTTVRWLDEHPADLAVVVPTEIVVESAEGDRWHATARRPFWEGMTRISATEMLGVNRAVPISVLYRRRVHDLVGWYDESLSTVEDWDFYLRMLVRGPIGFATGPVLASWTHRPHATDSSANSMFDLADQHLRDDATVRDRALIDWMQVNGPGLPMYLAAMEQRLLHRLERIEERIAATPGEIGREIDAHQPVWSRLRRWRRRWGTRRG